MDSVSYFVLGKVFVANMAGNLIFVGFGLSAVGPAVASSAIAIGAFLVGCVTGGRAVQSLAHHRGRLLCGRKRNGCGGTGRFRCRPAVGGGGEFCAAGPSLGRDRRPSVWDGLPSGSHPAGQLEGHEDDRGDAHLHCCRRRLETGWWQGSGCGQRGGFGTDSGVPAPSAVASSFGLATCEHRCSLQSLCC
ncbi:DUF1275 domain-containing protein [Streptomyces sp. ISL-1]|nr:DUF1275 domain-containing protein [Streptomyces sp. ISL-1]